MGRIIAFLVGGAALVHWGALLVLPQETLSDYVKLWTDAGVSQEWFGKITGFGPGVVAGIALLLLAVRGRD